MELIKRGVLFFLFLSLNSALGAAAAPADFVEWNLAAQNEEAALYIHPRTTEIALHSLLTGKIWFSNPPSRDPKGGAAQEIISLGYDTPTIPDRRLNSFQDSVQYGQFTIVPLPNGVRVEYLLGEEYEGSKMGLPQMIKKERLEQLVLARISDEGERAMLQRYYTLVSLEKPTEVERVSSKEIQTLEKQLFGEYILVAHSEEYRALKREIEALESALPAAEGDQELKERLRLAHRSLEKIRGDLVYELVEKLTGYAIGGLETRTEGYRGDAEKPGDLSPADFQHLIGRPTYLLGKIPAFLERQLAGSLREIGYGLPELTADHLENYLDPPLPNQIVFKIPVEYTLDGPDLVVRVPMEEVAYPREVYADYLIDFTQGPQGDFLSYDHGGIVESYPLTSLSLLRFFGAGTKEQEGYLFVPDGSGGLIYFNNGRVGSPLYSARIYGPDAAIPSEETSSYTKQINHWPVFGVKHEDGGFLAIVEKGEALASIRGDIARDSVPYNAAFSVFEVTPKSSRRLDQHTEIVMYQRRMYRGDLQVRYRFLKAEEADYVGMAASYQDYLVKRGLLVPKTTVDVPFFLEVTGAVSAIRPILGIPRETALPLTTFKQAENLVHLLGERGIQKPILRYNGWLSGGLEHVVPNKARLEKKLGTDADLKELKAALDKLGGVLYPDVRFLEIYKTRPGDGFSVRRDAARAVTGLIAQVHPYDPVLLKPNLKESHYLLTPSRLDKFVDGFLKDYQLLNLEGVALSQFGQQIHSDFRGQEAGVIDRQEAVEMVKKQLAKFKNRKDRILLDGGNAFALPYAQAIMRAPLRGTQYDLLDREVPFYALVVRGYLDFAGPPLNLSPYWQEEVLKAVEAGAGLSFSWVYDGAEQLKGTRFAYLYDVGYEHWLERACQVYDRVRAALEGLQGQTIVEHAQLAPGVYKTRFSGGDAVFVNYNEYPLEVEGLWVNGLGFTRRKEDDSGAEIAFSLDFD